jgi:uncharacterized membrane protein (DUF485 family)
MWRGRFVSRFVNESNSLVKKKKDFTINLCITFFFFDFDFLMLQDLPTKSSSFVTTLTSEKTTGNLVIGGFADGSLKLYDRRVPSKDR